MRGIIHSEDFGWAVAPQKGSSGTSTTVQNNSPPPEVLANYQAITQQAANVANQPYPVYDGSLIAGFNPQQQAAFQNINTASTAAQPFIDNASQLATNATQLLSPQNFGGTIAAYQDPYTQQVVNATQAEFANQNDQQRQKIRGNAISQGAFGGDREAVEQGIAAGQEQLAQAPVIAGLNDKGFTTALNAAQGNAWLNSQGAFSMGQLGQEAQTTGLQGAGAQLQAGTLQQQLAQQQLNLPYEAFLAAQGFPYQATGWQSNIDLGLGSASGGTGSTTVPGPSALSQAAGVGTALAGLGSAANNAGLFSGGGGGGGVSAADAASAAAFQAGAFSQQPAGTFGPFNARGGRIQGFAGGGVPNLDVSFIPEGPASNSMGHSMMMPAGTTSSTSGGGPSDAQQAGQAISTVASLASLAALAMDRGGRISRDEGGPVGFGGAEIPRVRARSPALSVARDVLASLGGLGSMADMARMPRMDSQGGRVTGLDPFGGIEGYDIGGTVPSAPTQAMFSGNPLMAQNFSQYANLPTEKLQEMAVRMPPTTPQGQMISRALQQRRMAPQSDPAQQLQQSPVQQGQTLGGIPQGFAVGGALLNRGVMPDDQEFDELMNRGWHPYMRGHTGDPTTDSRMRTAAPPARDNPEISAGRYGGLGSRTDYDPVPQGMSAGGFLHRPFGGATGGPSDMQQAAMAYETPYDSIIPELGADAGPMPGLSDVPTVHGPAISQTPINGVSGGHSTIPAPPSPDGGLGTEAGDTGEPLGGLGTLPPTDTTGGSATVGRHKSVLSDPDTLIAMGLGMLGGKSPFPGVNIGQGALEGMKYGESKALREEQAALRGLQAQQLADYRKAIVPIKQQTADAASTRAETGALTGQAKIDIQNRALELRRAGLDETTANHRATQEYHQQQGDLALGKAFDTTNYRQSRLDQIDQTIALRRQAMQFAQTEAGRKAAQTADAGNLQRAISLVNSSRDPFTRQPKTSLEDAMTQVQGQHTQPSSSGARTGAYLPLPRSESQLIPEQTYNTGKGPARWDGSKFIPLSP